MGNMSPDAKTGQGLASYGYCDVLPSLPPSTGSSPARRPTSRMHLTHLIPRLVVALISLLLACPMPAYELRGNVPAPEFPIGLPWLNVEKAIRMSDLRGKVVILDFWTYGCINCIHVIEDLKRLEEKYRHHLVVIGVHTHKFDNVKNLETLRRVLVRYKGASKNRGGRAAQGCAAILNHDK